MQLHRAINSGHLKAVLRRACEETNTPGAAIGLVSGQESCSAVYGFAHLASQMPVQASTKFNIGCAIKAWVALLAIRLCDAGVLSLDKPIHVICPTANVHEAIGAKVTVRHLLSYSAGFDNNVQIGQDQLDTNDDFAAFSGLIGPDDILHQPGDVFAYGPSSFIVLAHVLQSLTGRSLQELMDEFVFRPADVDHSLECTGARGGHGCGYYRDESNELRELPPDIRFARPYIAAHDRSGFSLDEMLRLCEFTFGLKGEGRGAFAEGANLINELVRCQIPVFHSHLTDWGLGWSVWGTESIGHNGFDLGYSAHVRMSLSNRATIVLLSNCHENQHFYTRVFDELGPAYLECRTSVSRPEMPADDNLLLCTGVFCGAGIVAKLTVAAGRLCLQARVLKDLSDGLIEVAAQLDEAYRFPKFLKLSQATRDVFLAEGDRTAIVFLCRDVEGTPMMLRYGNKVLARKA